MRRLTPILIILLLAASTRIINVSHWPVWTDEGWSTYAASDHNIGVILNKVAEDRHPPLYFLALSAWWSVAGDSRLALRFLAIMSGILTVAVVYRIGKDWFGARAGRYAALLLAVLDVAVYYSQEIRHYGWLMLAVSLMTLFFLRYLRRPSRGLWIAYALSVAFMFYSLYIGVLILAVQGVIGLFVWRTSRRQKMILVGAWAAAGVLYLPWLAVISRQADILAGGIDGLPTTLASLLTVGGFLFGGQMALTAGLYVLASWHVLRKADRSVQWLARVTIIASGAGLVAFMFIANLKIGMLSARTMVYLTPMLVLISGYGFSLLADQPRRVLAVLLVVIALGTNDFVQPRLNSNAIAQAVAAQYMPGDLVILENGWDDNAVRYELMLTLGENAPIVRTTPWVDNRGNPNVPVVPKVEKLIKAQRRVWVVNWFQPPQVIPFLDQGGDGFVRVMTLETPTGDQYKPLYADQTMRAVLFERPDLSTPTPATTPPIFGDMLSLDDALLPADVARGSRVQIDLWWRALTVPPLDYSVGVFLMDSAGKVVTQHDGPPGDKPTSQWIPGTGPTFDRHALQIPADLPVGTYQIGVQVYWYGDRKPLPIKDAQNTDATGTAKDTPYWILGKLNITP